jgi:hypothetical protein
VNGASFSAARAVFIALSGAIMVTDDGDPCAKLKSRVQPRGFALFIYHLDSGAPATDYTVVDDATLSAGNPPSTPYASIDWLDTNGPGSANAKSGSIHLDHVSGDAIIGTFKANFPDRVDGAFHAVLCPN